MTTTNSTSPAGETTPDAAPGVDAASGVVSPAGDVELVVVIVKPPPRLLTAEASFFRVPSNRPSFLRCRRRSRAAYPKTTWLWRHILLFQFGQLAK